MRSNAVIEIERAIDTLSAGELQELCLWLDQHKHPLDARIELDLAAGRLDETIDRALADAQSGRIRPL